MPSNWLNVIVQNFAKTILMQYNLILVVLGSGTKNSGKYAWLKKKKCAVHTHDVTYRRYHQY